ncbi:ATP-dependent Clp protease ATP-binding subunit ClpX [Striga asiatica]|uniref:ATP-dependent Clp protease ATP-binding subunit ClpX n=1 Tax=Striga asiatica TaxID=4170 RepID=A0A5A7RGG5_STRAF|nr:ATP-dependent Clp protease ATP-binding subunit ClpX [Striga asiatica]
MEEKTYFSPPSSYKSILHLSVEPPWPRSLALISIHTYSLDPTWRVAPCVTDLKSRYSLFEAIVFEYSDAANFPKPTTLLSLGFKIGFHGTLPDEPTLHELDEPQQP